MHNMNILSQHWSTIQGFLFPSLREKLGPLSRQHMQVISTIELLRVEDFIKVHFGYVGRPPKDRVAIAHAFIAKALLNLPFTSSLLDRLQVDVILRQICGWESKKSIPSESTFSRAFAEFANSELLKKIHEILIKRNLKGHLFGHVSRDSTAIEGREKRKKAKKLEDVAHGSDVSVNMEREREVSEEKPECTPVQGTESSSNQYVQVTAGKRKRGRPKNSKKKIKPPTRLERQQKMSLEEMLEDLPKSCDLGCKRSRGYKETWKGYKLHLDVSDGQIPISCILTSASLADSQVAIPLSVMTSERITNLYDLMDSAYDSEIIKEYSRSLGHVPIIEMNPRRNKKKQQESKAEPKRLKLLNIQMPATVRYNERNSVERVNGRLGNEFGGQMVRVRGHAKVMTHLMFGILALTVDQLMRFIL